LYNQNIVVGVWTGNNNNEDMPGGWSSTVPLPLASSFLSRIIENYPSGTYNRPAGVLTTSVCLDSGASAQENTDCTKEASLYITGRPPQVDSRKLVEVCAQNGLIPENLDAARRYGLTEEKVLLNNTLENALQIDAYHNYLLSLEGSRYIFTEPEKAICPLPLGAGNAPVIDLLKPTSNQSVTRGVNVEISGQVRYLEKINEFKVQFAGNDISGASLKTDGTFVVNYFVPLTTSLGNQTITVSVKDNFGKTDTKSVTVKVVDQSSSVTVFLANPVDGANIAFPVNLIANVSGGTVSEVTFSIFKIGGDYSKTFTDSDPSGSWSYNWEKDDDVKTGQYRITVSAKVGDAIITGNTITVKYQ